MCYSFDVLKKLAFEKEIEHIKNHHKDPTLFASILTYMQQRIKEIDNQYGEPAVRDF